MLQWKELPRLWEFPLVGPENDDWRSLLLPGKVIHIAIDPAQNMPQNLILIPT
jgi:hypothetical protein